MIELPPESLCWVPESAPEPERLAIAWRVSSAHTTRLGPLVRYSGTLGALLVTALGHPILLREGN